MKMLNKVKGMITDPDADLVVPDCIYTFDGHELGRVAEIQGNALRLKRRWRADLWITRDLLLPMPWNGRTVTRFGKDVLDRYCRSTPPERPLQRGAAGA
jgi:hypothetical protein